MKFFLFLWQRLNNPHCVCGCKGNPPICHSHEGGRKDGMCSFCTHGAQCHQL